MKNEVVTNIININDIINIVDFDEVKDYMYSNVPELSFHDMELIQSKPTKSEKMKELMRTLKAKNSDFKHFRDTLATSGVQAYEMLAKDLEAASSKFKLNKPDKLCKTGSKSLSLRIRKDKRTPISIKTIACQLGEDALTKHSDPVTDKRVLAMRALVGNISRKNKNCISYLTKNLHLLKKVKESLIETLAQEIFTSCNWGRIVVWFAFWFEVADYLEGKLEESEELEIRRCGKFVGSYLASKCGKWIHENGGWVS